MQKQLNALDKIADKFEKFTELFDDLDRHNASISSSKRSESLSMRIKLPEIHLPTYDGEVAKFQTFWESFSVLMHDRNDIEDVTKFSYLIDQLTNHPVSYVIIHLN